MFPRFRSSLALKVSGWLLLHITILVLLGVAFLGFGRESPWSLLVDGPPGRRLQSLADYTFASLRGLSTADSTQLLKRFAETYPATIGLADHTGQLVLGDLPTLPTEFSELLARRRPPPQELKPSDRAHPPHRPPPPWGPPPDRAPPGLGERPERSERERPPLPGPGFLPPPRGDESDFTNAPERATQPAPAAPPEEAGRAALPPPSNRPPPREETPPRLLLRTGDPVAYWIAARVGRPGQPPSWIVLRVNNLGDLLSLVDIKPTLALAAGVVVFSLLFWLPFVGRLTRDLRRLTRATEAIADGRFDTRVPEKGRDELGTLGSSVNRMAARLEQLVAGQKRFLGDIAHELGSPLGRLQVSVSILEERMPPHLQPALGDVREEIEHMSKLVNELLNFTRAGLRPREVSLAEVPLAALVDHVMTREAANDAVTLECPPDLAVHADAELLGRAIGNLIRNSLLHAGRNAHACLRASREGSQVTIVIEDHGPGVPPEALARLGEPLYRPEVARRRETGGTGLGLAIVKSCLTACGGTVDFANRLPHGFQATLRLPSASRRGTRPAFAAS